MSEPTLNAKQRRAARDLLAHNTALLSGAGCGKTFVLAQRFTALLLRARSMSDDESVLSRFVALTFTDKAALEMAQRVRRLIEERLALAKGDDRAVLLGWLEELPEARISTIHGFCASLLRSAAIEAGLDPAFGVCANEIVTAGRIADAVEQAVLEAIDHSAAPTTAPAIAPLLLSDRLDNLLRALTELVRHRSRIDFAAHRDPTVLLNHWRTQAEDARRRAMHRLRNDADLARRIGQLAEIPCNDPDDKLRPIRDGVVTLAREILHEHPTPEQFAALADLQPGRVGGKKAWPDPKDVRDRIRTVQDQIGEYAAYVEPLNDADEQAAENLAALTALTERAVELYREENRTNGELDFDDLQAVTRDLLRDRPDLRVALGSVIEQMLIDEAQDTDATQMELLLSLLTPDEPAAAPLNGKLFLVGDPKQSIYRFRGAQVEVFDDLVRRIGPAGHVDLDVSFRTHRAGVTFVNELFAPLMGENYTPIGAHRTDLPPMPSVEILLARTDEDQPDRTGQELQARLTAERIEQMLADGEPRVRDVATGQYRPVRAGDIAVLFARQTHSPTYERELQKRGIAYYVLGGGGFYQQQEVRDVLNALRAIDHPGRSAALLGALRSGLFGVSDETLMHLRLTHEELRLDRLQPERLAGRAPDDQRRAVEHAATTLRALTQCKDAVGIDELLGRLLDTTGYEAVLLGQFQGRRRAGNLRLLRAHARAATGELHLAGFLDQMDEMIVSEQRAEQAGVVGEAEDVVRLVTIHKAKGLEFPVVVIPDLNHGARPRRSPILVRRDWGLTTRLLSSGEGNDEDDNAPTLPLSYRLAKRDEAEDERRETLRKYYVALTRHEDHLVLIGLEEYYRDTGAFRSAGSFLAAMDNVLDLRGKLVAGDSEFLYGPEGEFRAVLRRVVPADASDRRRSSSPGETMLHSAEGIADVRDGLDALAERNTAAAPLVGPIAPDVGEVELAVTALSEFEQCPMLYRWRYELRAPTRALDEAPSAATSSSEHDGLDALTRGTVLHACLEQLDLDRPQSARALAAQVLADMDLDADPDAVAREVATMLKTFAQSPLATELQDAEEIHRETAILLPAGPARLRGQIDLLYRRDGMWHIVDYKSDRVSPGDLHKKLARYELQLLAYSLAIAERAGGEAPRSARLYFMRTGEEIALPLTAETLDDTRRRLDGLARALIVARRENRFVRCDRPDCDFCRRPEFAHLGSVANR